MNIELALFALFAFFTVVSASTVLVARNPINSAMALVATFFFLAGIYVLLWAHTIAVLQVLVYAGAIMVLFTFVIMLLSLPTETGKRTRPTVARLLGGAAAVGLFAVLAVVLLKVPGETVSFTPQMAASFGTLKSIGAVLYTQWLLPFEAVSLLLLVAIVGAVVVAKSRI